MEASWAKRLIVLTDLRQGVPGGWLRRALPQALGQSILSRAIVKIPRIPMVERASLSMIGKAMLDKLRKIFAAPAGQDGAVPAVGSDLQVAAAALMVEAAEMDEAFGDDEHAKISSLIQARFGLDEAQASQVIQSAERKVDASVQNFGFTKTINDSFTHDERVELMSMLWEVVYVDGELHDLEASLMRRVAGLLFVSDHENGRARKEALRRLEEQKSTT